MQNRGEAVSSIFGWFFLDVRGRIGRQEYWLGLLLTLLVLLLIGPRLEDLSLALLQPRRPIWSRDELDFALLLPKLLLVAVAGWPLVAITGKRLHDLGLSAWWLVALPAVQLLATMSHVDRWHVAGRILLVVIGLLPGRRGDNRFGADPRARAPSPP